MKLLTENIQVLKFFKLTLHAQRIADVLGEMPHPIDMHRVRLVAPGKWMLCASFRLPAVAALTKESSIREFA